MLALRVCLEYAYVLALKSTVPMCWCLEYSAYVLALRVQCLCVGAKSTMPMCWLLEYSACEPPHSLVQLHLRTLLVCVCRSAMLRG